MSTIARSALLVAIATSLAMAQPAPLSQSAQHYVHDSEPQFNGSAQTLILDTHVIHVPGATALRVIFDELILGEGDMVRVTSQLDGEVHEITPTQAENWGNTSAYFNGNTITLDLIVAAGSTASYRTRELYVGQPMANVPQIDTICGSDDRIASTDWRSMRLVNGANCVGNACVGCTIWIGGIDSSGRSCMITAGHCIPPHPNGVAESEVPASASNTNVVHPPVRFQWPLNASSITSQDTGIGDDWAFCRVNNNSLGEQPHELYGTHQLDFRIPSGTPTLRVTGYGTDTGTTNQTNQTSTGPYVSNIGTRLQYAVDTTGGNSGSPVIDEASGNAVGIHTNAGCTSTGGSNSGTSITNSAFRSGWEAFCTAGSPDHRKLMLTEVSWGDPDCVEIANFGTTTIDLSSYFVRWTSGSTINSSPIGGTIAPGEIVIIKESGTISGVPGTVRQVQAFSGIGTTSQDLTVSLMRNISVLGITISVAVDEVRITDTTGSWAEGSNGGNFRGVAVRGVVSGTGGNVGVERIWGLDSDSGSDWTEQPNRSMGLENRNSGPRGTDPVAMGRMLITECDDSPDYFEIYNAGNRNENLEGWTFLTNSFQGETLTLLDPFNGGPFYVAPGEYVVIGETAAAPAEKPANVRYLQVTQNIPWASDEYQLAMYDNLGRLVDLVRTTGHDDEVVLNHPRCPAHPLDFVGAAGRDAQFGGDGVIVRYTTANDSNDGGDWRPAYVRTMGSSNNNYSGNPGLAASFDCRVNEGAAPGNGITVILNGGPGLAGAFYTQFLSAGHSFGVGPFYGLGSDALANYAILQSAPFSGTLDAQGSARYDFNPTTVGSGIDADVIFIAVQGGTLVRTAVLEFDT